MLYRYVWVLLLLVYRGIFKRGFYFGEEKLQRKKPYIIASNHCNAFLDPVIVATQVNRSINFLVRGDVFQNKIARFFLRALHQIPIYRQQDIQGNILEKNEETFKEVYQLLEQKKVVMIFPEGDCVPEKRLRPLKKGIARMAFGVMEKNKWQLDLQILPLAVNYTHHTQLQTEIMVGFDEAIALKNYQQLFKENPAKATNLLTAEIKKGIENQIISVNKSIEEEVEMAYTMLRNKFNYPFLQWYYPEKNRLLTEKKIALHLEQKYLGQPEEYQKFKHKIHNYFLQLKQFGITDFGLQAFSNNIKPNYLSYILWPVYVLGYLMAKPIEKFVNTKVNKIIKKAEFKLSIKMGFILAIYQILALVVLIILWSIFNLQTAVITLLVIYVTNWLSVKLNDVYKSNKEIITVLKLKRKNKDLVSTLIENQRELYGWINL